MTLGDREREGRQAANEYEQLKRAAEILRKSLFEAFCATKTGDAEARERLHATASALDGVMTTLLTIASEAPLAEKEEQLKVFVNG